MQQLVVPLLGMQVEKHRAPRVGGVRHMRMPLHQMPRQEAIDGAKAQLAPARAIAHIQRVQQPLQLGAGKIGVGHQAGLFADHFGMAVPDQLFHIGRRATALPHNGVMQPRAGFTIPQHGGFALIGNADGRNFSRVDAGIAHRGTQRFNLRGQDIAWIMLHPAGIGIVLRELLRGRANHAALDGKHHRTGGRGALIQRHQIAFVHMNISF